MNNYRIYSLRSSKSEVVPAKFPQEALLEYVHKKTNVDKKFILCKKMNTPMDILHENNSIKGFIVVGLNSELHFYLVKLDMQGFYRYKSEKNNKSVIFLAQNYDGSIVVPIMYDDKLKTTSEQVWNILTQLHTNGIIFKMWTKNSSNFFTCSVSSAGGSDYDDPTMNISVDNINKTIKISAISSHGREIVKVVPWNDGVTLLEMLRYCEMVS